MHRYHAGRWDVSKSGAEEKKSEKVVVPLELWAVTLRGACLRIGLTLHLLGKETDAQIQ